MQRLSVSNSLLYDYAPLALRLLRAHDEEALISARMQLEGHQVRLDVLKCGVDATTLFDHGGMLASESLICDLLNVIHARESRRLGLFYDEDLLAGKLKTLATLPKNKTSADLPLLELILNYVRITAQIIELNKVPISFDTIETRCVSDAMQIVINLYDFRTYVSALTYQPSSVVTSDLFHDLCVGLPNIVQGLVIKDCSAQTEIEEYAHDILEILVDKLISVREMLCLQEIDTVHGEAEELTLDAVSLRELSLIRGQIAKIDALLWRLNLHAHPSIRTQLQRHIAINQISANKYIIQNMRHDFRRRTLISGLIDNSHHAEIDEMNLQNMILDKFDNAIQILTNHVEDITRVIATIDILNSTKDFTKNEIDDIEEILNVARNDCENLSFDCTLLACQINAMQISHAEKIRLCHQMQMLSLISDAFYYKVAENTNLRKACLRKLSNFQIMDIRLEDLANDKLTSAFSILLQIKFDISVEDLSVNSQKRADLLFDGARYLCEMMDKCARLYKMPPDHIHTFIKDYYSYLLVKCVNKAELDYLTRDNLMSRVLRLKVPGYNQTVYEVIFDITQRILLISHKNGIKIGHEVFSLEKKTLRNYLKKYNIESLTPDVHPHRMSGFTISYFLSLGALISSFFEIQSDRLQQMKGKKILLDLRLYCGNIFLKQEEILSHTSPGVLQYRNSVLIKDFCAEPRIDYPGEETLLTRLFSIYNEIQQAKTSEELTEIQKEIDSAVLVLSSYDLAFNDIVNDKASEEVKSQFSLFKTEKQVGQLLRMILVHRKKMLVIPITDEDNDFIRDNLDNLCNISLVSKNSHFSYLYKLYVVICARCICLDIKGYDSSDGQDANEILGILKFLLKHIYEFQYASKSKIRYQFNYRLPVELFDEMTVGLHTTMAPDRVDQGSAHKFLLEHINIAIARLLEVRLAVEKESNEHPASLTKENVDFDSHLDLLNKRYFNEEIDTVLFRFNLISHPELRKKHRYHLKNHKLNEEDYKLDRQNSNKRYFMLAGLVDLQSKDIEVNAKHLEKAAKILLSYAYQFRYHYSLISIVTERKYDDFVDLQQVYKLQMRCIFNDAKMLIMHAASMMAESNFFRLIGRDLSICHFISSIALNDVDPLYLTNSDDDFSGMKAFHLPLPLTIDSAICETISKLIQTEFDQSLDQAVDVPGRLLAIKNMAQYIDTNSRNLSSTECNKPAELAFRAQFVTDLFLYAYSSCQTNEEVECLFADNLKAIIFDLALTSYNGYARDTIFGHISETLRIKICSNVDNPSQSEMIIFDPVVTTAISLSLQKRFIALSIAVSEYEKSRHDQKAAIQIIPMNSEVYTYFCSIAKELLLALKKPNLINCLQKEKESIIFQLENFRKLLNPAEQSYRPIVIEAARSVVRDFVPVAVARPVKTKLVNRLNPPQISSSRFAVYKNMSSHNHLTNSNEVTELYNNQVEDIISHYLSILNNHSFRVKNDEKLIVNAIIGLAETLAQIKDIKVSQEVVAELERHAEPIIARCDPEHIEHAMYGQYQNYIRLITQYKLVALPIIETAVILQVDPPAQVQPQDKKTMHKMISYKPSLFSVQLVRSVTPSRLKSPPKYSLVTSRAIPQELAEFSSMWKDITLNNIELSINELNILTLLRQHHLTPLLQGGAVVDNIRGVPYRDIDCICFSTSAELENLFNNNKNELGIHDVRLIHDTFFRLTFNAENSAIEPEVLDIAFIPDKSNGKATALHKLAYDFGLGLAIYYCIFNKVIIDPCKQYTRIKQHILDVSRVLDDFNVDRFFAERPDRLLVCLAKDAKCRKYGVTLNANFIKEVIMRHKLRLHADRLDSKFTQSLFDKFFIHGYANHIFTIIHDECDIMHMLFPMFGKNFVDIETMRRACKLVTVRHQECERELMQQQRFDPSKRVSMLSSSQENYLRITFLNDLLKQKFIDTYAAHRYVNEYGECNKDFFSSDIRKYVRRLSFVVNKSVIESLEVDWWQAIVNSAEAQKQNLRMLTM